MTRRMTRGRRPGALLPPGRCAPVPSDDPLFFFCPWLCTTGGMEACDTTCPLCLEPDMALNTMLLRYGPESTAVRKRLEHASASPDGVLATHWRHLRTMLSVPMVMEEPAPDADPLLK